MTYTLCPSCRGVGYEKGHPARCSVCHGTGAVPLTEGKPAFSNAPPRPTQELISEVRERIAWRGNLASDLKAGLLAILDDYEKLREYIGDNLPEDELTEEQLQGATATKERLLGVVRIVKENQGLREDVQRLTEEVERWKKSNREWAILAQSPRSYND